MTEAPLLRLRGITRHYGHGDALVRALAGIDLDVERGTFVSLMGPSGSGKSTALNILGCLDEPTSGTYHFRGVEVGGLTADQRALLRRNWLGFVFQGFNLLARTSALENVALPLVYRGVGRTERLRRAGIALSQVGLAHVATHAPNELSGGQQQRVAIARAIVSEPDVLLADEPTGNLDSAMSVEIVQLLARLNAEQGITVVMVTHEPEIAAYTHRIVHFKDGCIERDERVAEGV